MDMTYLIWDQASGHHAFSIRMLPLFETTPQFNMRSIFIDGFVVVKLQYPYILTTILVLTPP